MTIGSRVIHDPAFESLALVNHGLIKRYVIQSDSKVESPLDSKGLL